MSKKKIKTPIYTEFLNLEEVALYLGVSSATVYRYITDEKDPLPSFQLTGKTIRVKKEELDKWLENYRKEGNNENEIKK